MFSKISKIFIVLLLIIAVFYVNKNKFVQKVFEPRNVETSNVVSLPSVEEKDIEIVATNLSIPWELVFLPDGNMLVTQRGGELLKIGKDTKIIAQIQGVKHIGEGGLLGMALDPKFSSNKYLYLYKTIESGGKITNAVERYKLQNDSLIDQKTLIDGIEGSSNHDGGRIAFGPDGYLYITTGDAQRSNLAQDINSLNGKILRIDRDGNIPEDNPFENAVYSIGHRNSQGLAWDEKGNLWATEHGPSGIQTGNDEVNLIKKGANYGWPVIRGSQKENGMSSPVIESGKNDTWAPSGVSYINGNLFFAGLRGEALYQAKISENNSLTLTENFKNQFGRLRTVVNGPDGFLYILTNNTDGRGDPGEGDDKIIRVSVQKLLSQ